MLKEWVLFSIIVLIFSELPIIGAYIKIFTTLIHENCHALVAILTGGQVKKISLLSNTGGLATTMHSNYLSRVLTTLSGYPLTSLASVGIVYLLVLDKASTFGIILMAILLLNALFWVRNIVGWLFVTFSLGIMYYLYSYHATYFEYVAIATGVSIWIQALTTSLHILVLSIKNPSDAGDASILSKATFIPPVAWGTFFALFSVGCFIFEIFLLFQYGNT